MQSIKILGAPIDPRKVDPRTLLHGTQERSDWFEEAMRMCGGFDPSVTDARRLKEGSLRWHIWCEYDRAEEALEMWQKGLDASATADQACQ